MQTATPSAAMDLLTTQLSQYRETTLKALLSALPDREPREYLYAPLAAHRQEHQAGTVSGDVSCIWR